MSTNRIKKRSGERVSIEGGGCARLSELPQSAGSIASAHASMILPSTEQPPFSLPTLLCRLFYSSRFSIEVV